MKKKILEALERACKNCIHFNPTKDGQGECRANPPQVVVFTVPGAPDPIGSQDPRIVDLNMRRPNPVPTIQVNLQSVFPPVVETARCGIHMYAVETEDMYASRGEE